MEFSKNSMSYRNRGNLRYYVNKKGIPNDTNNVNYDVKSTDYDVTIVYPDIVKTYSKPHHRFELGYTDTMNKSIKCKQYGQNWLDFDRNQFNTVWSDVDMRNFKKAVLLACEVMRKEQGHVAILGIRKLLKDNNVIIVSYEVLSAIVKKWLVNNPNPKKNVVRRNTVRHNRDDAQVCPVNDGSIALKSSIWIKQAMTSEW